MEINNTPSQGKILAENFILAFTPNKRCIKVSKNKKDKTLLTCGKMLNPIPAKFGSERYCSTCIHKPAIVDQLVREMGEHCSSNGCISYAKKKVEGQQIFYGEDRFCYICLHTLEVQKKLHWERTGKNPEEIKFPPMPVVLEEEKNWLNTVFFEHDDLFKLMSVDKITKFTKPLEGDIPDHLRYIIEILLNDFPKDQAKMLMWINDNSSNVMKLDVKKAVDLKARLLVIRNDAINQIINKLEWILFRQHHKHLNDARNKLIYQLDEKSNKDILEDTFYFVVQYLTYPNEEPSKEYVLLTEFIKEEIVITKNKKDKLTTTEIYNRLLLWAKIKGIENAYGGGNVLGRDLKRYTDTHESWEIKISSGVNAHFGIKFKD